MSDEQRVTQAQLAWDEQGQPLSASFGDVYFSRANGLEETRHVFLQHNQLAERWTALAPRSHFVIGETGFGSGLNFLAAWQLWLQVAPASAQLHFVSVEKYPLSRADLSRALALWPELAELAALLTEAYPCIVEQGFYRANFMDGRVRLTLIIDDAAAGFSQLQASQHPAFARSGAPVHAWFLDGFAPAKNPQMWSDQLFASIAHLSAPGTTAATFSAAGIVKNGLRSAGFLVQKVAGFGRKRDMVKAFYQQATTSLSSDDDTSTESSTETLKDASEEAPKEPLKRNARQVPAPWAVDDNHYHLDDKRVLVIGAGLAGCSSARALAERGWQVTLLEQHEQAAQEGSGNPQGALYAKLSPRSEPLARFNLASLEFAQRFYQPYFLSGQPHLGERCGLLQLASDGSEAQLHRQLRERFADTPQTLVQWVDAAQASQLAGVALSHGGLYFPQAGWLNPPSLCQQLLQHPNIQVHYLQQVTALEPAGGGWQVHSQTLSHTANHNSLGHAPKSPEHTWYSPVVIIANARDARHFSQTAELPIRHIRGQVSYMPCNPASQALRTIVCAEGYIAPARQGQHCVGATFNLRDDSQEVREQDQATNLANLAQVLPHLADAWQQSPAAPLAGRVAFRCTLPDYLPMVGPVPQLAPLRQRFAPLRRDARARIDQPGHYWPGLFINIGHGSRGLAYTPLCAELLAGMINREPLPLARELADQLNPARFAIRDLIKNRG